MTKLSYDQWMKDTAAFGRTRSKELKALDIAFHAYELAERSSNGSILREKQALTQALEAWKKSKGATWRSSIRNRSKAVERLDAQLNLVIVGKDGLSSRGELVLDPAELQARKEVARAIKENTRTLFAGQKLTVKNTAVLSDLNQVRGSLSKFKSAAKEASRGGEAAAPVMRPQVQGLLVALFDNAPLGEIQQALGPIFTDFVASVTPFLGAVSSGKNAVASWGRAAHGLYKRSQMRDAAGSFAPGDPAAAFDAILVIMTREIHADATTAGVHTASAAAKAAFTAADFGTLSGPAVGGAETLALLVQKIYLFARDWNETKAANALLAQGVYDLTLFKASPLLGACLIANSDTSAIINIAVADYGRPGWKFEVEMMVKKAQPVYAKAREVVKASRYELAGLHGMKGTATDRNAKLLGLPKGKLDGLVADVSTKINRLGA